MNRAEIRENVFKLLFCNEFNEKKDMPKQYELFWDNVYNEDETVKSMSEKDRDYIAERAGTIAENIEKIDEEINRVSVGWTTKRMAIVDLIIIRLAYYEMKMDEDIPQKVAVDQAIELAKKYGSDDSPAFVNGILAKLF